jgi:hypothetical protein
VKRRALLLGALLMPMPAVARTTRKPRQKKPAVPPALPPLKEARSQLVNFNASAFPYSGYVPDTRKPFLDVRQGRRRGHTTLKGDVCWEDTTYSDRRSLLYLPAGFNPMLPSLVVIFLHGQGATLERDVMNRQGLPRQIAQSGQNIALVAPQLAFDAADSSAGNFWRPGHFARYIDEAAERLMRLYGDRRAGPKFNAAPVVVVAYSGGYVAAAYSLERGGAAHRVKGVILMDALYGDEEKFAAWAAARRHLGFLLSAYTDSTQEGQGNLQGMLGKRRIPFATALPASLKPGTMAFVSCGSWELHGDFVTRAWTSDPIARALTMIPGYPQTLPRATVHAKKKR